LTYERMGVCGSLRDPVLVLLVRIMRIHQKLGSPTVKRVTGAGLNMYLASHAVPKDPFPLLAGIGRHVISRHPQTKFDRPGIVVLWHYGKRGLACRIYNQSRSPVRVETIAGFIQVAHAPGVFLHTIYDGVGRKTSPGALKGKGGGVAEGVCFDVFVFGNEVVQFGLPNPFNRGNGTVRNTLRQIPDELEFV